MTVEIKGTIVTMTLQEYEDLYEDQVFLKCLQHAGVDNWEGYEYAQEEFQQYLEE